MASLMKNLAPDYASSKSYSAGDRVLYNNKLYNCTKATTGTFDADCWQDIYLSDLIKGGLNSNLGGFELVGEKYNFPNSSTANVTVDGLEIGKTYLLFMYAFQWTGGYDYIPNGGFTLSGCTITRNLGSTYSLPQEKSTIMVNSSGGPAFQGCIVEATNTAITMTVKASDFCGGCLYVFK